MKKTLFFSLIIILTTLSTQSFATAKTIDIAFIKQKRMLSYLKSIKEPLYSKGIQLALDEFNNSQFSKKNKIIIRLNSIDGGVSALDLQKAYVKAANSDALAIIGVPTSKEALLVGPLVQKHEVLTISTSASHDKISEYAPYFFTGATTSIFDSRLYIKLVKKHGAKKVLIVSNVNEPYSTIRAQTVTNALKEQVEITHIKVTGTALLSQKQLEEIQKEGKYDFIFLPLYSYQGVMVINQLDASQMINKTPILVSAALHYDVNLIKKFLKKVHKIYCLSTWSPKWDDKTTNEFKENFQKRFQKPAAVADALEYSIFKVLLQAVKKSSAHTREDLLASFRNVRFADTPVGPMYLDPCRQHTRKQTILLQLDQNKEFDIVEVIPPYEEEECSHEAI